MTTLIELSTLQARWLAARQAVIAQNVAQAATPGFRAQEITPFSEVLASTMDESQTANEARSTWQVTVSGNTVSLEEQMVAAGEVSRAHQMNAAIAKAFHRMFIAAAKAG